MLLLFNTTDRRYMTGSALKLKPRGGGFDPLLEFLLFPMDKDKEICFDWL